MLIIEASNLETANKTGSDTKAMSITERAVKNPAGVAVAVAIISVFGLFSLNGLPVQLFPDIDGVAQYLEWRYKWDKW